MADSDDTPEGGDGPSEYVNERQLVAARFIALGGGSTIDMDLAKMPVLADLVTPQHRDLVKDLAAQGLSNEAVARIMGISKERLQTLFAYELGTAFEIAKASLARAAYWKGIAGSESAMALWLRNHNRSDWISRIATEKTDKGAEQASDEISAIKDLGQNVLAAMLSAMSTDKKLFKPPKKDKPAPVKAVESAKVKPVKAGTTLKKPKGD
jgi:AraC-like DNA-binding protein